MSNRDVISPRDLIRDASLKLEELLSSIDFEDAQIDIIIGYPRSDIGKAELVAGLGAQRKDQFSVVKIDGFLNTNLDGRHPSRTRNDFVVYRRIHDHISFGGAHLILNAPLMQDFFLEFGECEEHLTFGSHLSKFFVRRLYDNWIQLGKPRYLVVEVGGVFADREVLTYIVPGLIVLRGVALNTRMILLSEAGYNNEGIKIRPLIGALEAARSFGLSCDLVFARLPADFPSSMDLLAMNAYAEAKIRDSLVCGGSAPTVLCVPFFKNILAYGYSEFIREFQDRVFPKPRIGS